MDDCFVIAEAGVNHNGDLARALDLVDAAADAGADAVKFQTFKADLIATAAAPKADYQTRQIGERQSQAEMLRGLELGTEAFRALAARCAERNIEFMSTPFDEPSVDLLVSELGVKSLKVSSGDLTNGPLLLRMAQAGRPVILSTGMSVLSEIQDALGIMAFGLLNAKSPSQKAFAAAYASSEGRQALQQAVTILHCTTEYPTPLEDVNLRAMDTLKEHFGLRVGYSDHTAGITVPVAAVARGAVVIEKHFTLDQRLPGPDHAASLEPDQLKAMVAAIRDVSVSLGSAEKVPAASELATAKVARRSLHAVRPIRQGEPFTAENVAPRRPGTGLSPMSFWDLLGKPASRAYEAEELIVETPCAST